MFTLFSNIYLKKEYESDALYSEKEQGIVFVRLYQMKPNRELCENHTGL